jgi:multisubunit Na+/H+ antiporter MnhB subunit
MNRLLSAIFGTILQGIAHLMTFMVLIVFVTMMGVICTVIAVHVFPGGQVTGSALLVVSTAFVITAVFLTEKQLVPKEHRRAK